MLTQQIQGDEHAKSSGGEQFDSTDQTSPEEELMSTSKIRHCIGR